MFLTNINSNVDFDIRLNLALDFVCELIKVTKKDFASLAISNLLAEELNFIQNTNFKKIDSTWYNRDSFHNQRMPRYSISNYSLLNEGHRI